MATTVERFRDLIEEGQRVLATEEPKRRATLGPTLDPGAFSGWKARAVQLLSSALGPEHEYTTQFRNAVAREGRPSSVKQGTNILAVALADLENGHLDGPKPAKAETLVVLLCERFHQVARQLRKRRAGRETLDVKDEYDVQDLLHAMLRLYFDDVRPEEYVPSYAGKSTRMDFLLKAEKVVVEVKMTRKGLGAAEVGAELIEDIAHYRTHPDCGLLLCFVYDPEGWVQNPRGLETDLARDLGGFPARVLIRPA